MEHLFHTAADGLRLHALSFALMSGAHDDARCPAVCLPGLARTAEDFVPLARYLSGRSAHPRRVLAVDYRGRGLSEYDPDWRHYSIDVERADLIGLLRETGIERAHVIGTSRGGLHILAMAQAHRDMIRSAVLNDIGPVIEPAGLDRIKRYVGRPIHPNSFEDAVAILKAGGGRGFDGLSAAEWRFFAETTFGTDEGALALRYDPQLARILDGFDLDRPLPDQWALFDQLAGLPVLTIRGGNSDLLSASTLTAMASRWPGSQAFTVSGQGHAPLLADEATIARIDAFLAGAD